MFFGVAQMEEADDFVGMHDWGADVGLDPGESIGCGVFIAGGVPIEEASGPRVRGDRMFGDGLRLDGGFTVGDTAGGLDEIAELVEKGEGAEGVLKGVRQGGEQVCGEDEG